MDFVKTEWLESLFTALSAINRKRRSQLSTIASILGVSYDTISRYYVPPRCQAVSPYSDSTPYSNPLLEVVNDFLKKQIVSPSPGKRHFFVLADAGMGKSSFLAILHYTSQTNFWPTRYKTHFEKLGPNTLANLQKIDYPDDCILLLDSLDEDPEASKDIVEYLRLLLLRTSNFFKVIITCRTQFFPGSVEHTGKIEVAGYRCEATYLSPFNDGEVNDYIQKRYPDTLMALVPQFLRKLFHIDGRNPHGKHASHLVQLMGDLSSRPLLLANLEDIIFESSFVKASGSKHSSVDERVLFGLLVRGWLRREQQIIDKSAQVVDEPTTVDMLLTACVRIAFFMHGTDRENVRVITKEELTRLQRLYPETGRLDLLTLEGRSLLIRDGEGNYRFAHYAIQEYLVVFGLTETIISTDCVASGSTLVTTAFMMKLLKQGPLPGELSRLKLLRYIFPEIPWSEKHLFDLRRLKIEGQHGFGKSDFTRQDLTEAEFVGVELCDSKFDGCSLAHANFSDIRLQRSSFCGAQLRGANLRGANLAECDFSKADLSGANLQGANLFRARFGWANLAGANLSGAELTNANFADANLEAANLNSAYGDVIVFYDANLCNATLSGARLSRAALSGANLDGARLEDSTLVNPIGFKEKSSRR